MNDGQKSAEQRVIDRYFTFVNPISAVVAGFAVVLTTHSQLWATSAFVGVMGLMGGAVAMLMIHASFGRR